MLSADAPPSRRCRHRGALLDFRAVSSRAAAAAIVCLLAASVAQPASGEPASSASDLLVRYLRIDSSNPPGNEADAARFLADRLHRRGVPTRLLVSPEGRTSLYARLDGGPKAEGTLVLLHHMDVVPPGPGWSTEPFSGERRDGFVWGAGAVDDKSLGIAHLMAFLDRHRRGGELAHHLVFLAVADEETGGRQGTGWLLERHPDLFDDVVGVWTEGGSNRTFDGRIQWWGVEVAQKRPLWLELTTQGKPGHGSKLDLHTAPHRLVRALDRLLERPRVYRITDEARLFFSSVGAIGGGFGDDWLPRLEQAIAAGRAETTLRPGQHNLFLDTFQITRLEAGRQVNVIPRRARALIDVRVLPDTDTDDLLADLRATLGPEVRIEVVLDAPAVPPSPTDTPLYRCLEPVLEPRAPLVPTFIAGVTDARYFRQRGIPAYGLSPFAIGLGDAYGVHGVNERISVEVFETGVERMIELVRRCTAPADRPGERPAA